MVKKAKASPQEEMGKHGRRRWVVISSAILFLIIALGLVFSGLFLQSEAKFPLTAAIVDQLATDFPDPSFVSSVTHVLQSHGFNVTYYNGTIDVEFYRKLANYNYGIIILRAHSALRNDNSTVDLFTSERYAPGIHDQELADGSLAVGEFYYKPDEEYFVVTSKFIEDRLEGHFSQSIVIAMGCQSLKSGCEQMAAAFVQRGAKAYVGWSDIIFPEDTDKETTRLVGMLLDENLTVGDAVSDALAYTYSGTPYPNSTQLIRVTSEMRFYPQSEVGLTVSELIGETKSVSGAGAFAALDSLSSCLVARRAQQLARLLSLSRRTLL